MGMGNVIKGKDGQVKFEQAERIIYTEPAPDLTPVPIANPLPMAVPTSSTPMVEPEPSLEAVLDGLTPVAKPEPSLKDILDSLTLHSAHPLKPDQTLTQIPATPLPVAAAAPATASILEAEPEASPTGLLLTPWNADAPKDGFHPPKLPELTGTFLSPKLADNKPQSTLPSAKEMAAAEEAVAEARKTKILSCLSLAKYSVEEKKNGDVQYFQPGRGDKPAVTDRGGSFSIAPFISPNEAAKIALEIAKEKNINPMYVSGGKENMQAMISAYVNSVAKDIADGKIKSPNEAPKLIFQELHLNPLKAGLNEQLKSAMSARFDNDNRQTAKEALEETTLSHAPTPPGMGA